MITSPCLSRITKRFEIADGNFEKAPDDKLCLSEYCKFDEMGIPMDDCGTGQ